MPTEVTDKLRALKVEEFLVESVEIDPQDIQRHFATVAATYAYWSHQYAEADRNLKLSKLEEERTHAVLAIKHRQEMLDRGLKPTESQVEAKVVNDPEMVELTRERIEAEFQRERLKGVVNAVALKGQSLMSLGAFVRKELENDPAVRAAWAVAKDARRASFDASIDD